GNCTGTAAMAKATAALNTVLKVSPRERFSAIDAISATPATSRSCFESRSSWRVSGVLTDRCAWSIPEMWPTSVAMRLVGCPDGGVAFRARHAPPGQLGLGDLQRPRLQQPAVSRHDVTRRY